MKTKEEIVRLVEQEDVEFIRLQFTDMFGNLKNVAITAGQLQRVLDHKYVIQSTAMFAGYYNTEDDLYLYPDPDTFALLPWRPQQGKVARLLCDVYDAEGNIFNLCPRNILKKVVAAAKEKGYTFYVDPECEFFLFHNDENGIPTTVTHEIAGYMDVGPIDMAENSRRDMVLTLEEMGFEIESSHHEEAPGQNEIDFSEGEALLIADSVVTFKSAVRSIAKRFGLHATFMPKPKENVAGSGMHLNISVYKDGRNLFNSHAGDKKLKEEADFFCGGVMAHVRSICAITNPLVNSYKRLMSGFDAPKYIGWSFQNDNALIRVRNRIGEDTKVELRFPDPSANPYLAIALCIAAGMDGMEKKISAGENIKSCRDKGIALSGLPETLREAANCMKEDSWVEEILGKEFVQIYTKAKLQEWNEYMAKISDWEIERYLNRV